MNNSKIDLSTISADTKIDDVTVVFVSPLPDKKIIIDVKDLYIRKKRLQVQMDDIDAQIQRSVSLGVVIDQATIDALPIKI